MILDGAPLIAIHKARYHKRKDGLALGPGPFVTGLEYATDCKATVVGKPENTFFTQVRNSQFTVFTFFPKVKGKRFLYMSQIFQTHYSLKYNFLMD